MSKLPKLESLFRELHVSAPVHKDPDDDEQGLKHMMPFGQNSTRVSQREELDDDDYDDEHEYGLNPTSYYDSARGIKIDRARADREATKHGIAGPDWHEWDEWARKQKWPLDAAKVLEWLGY